MKSSRVTLSRIILITILANVILVVLACTVSTIVIKNSPGAKANEDVSSSVKLDSIELKGKEKTKGLRKD